MDENYVRLLEEKMNFLDKRVDSLLVENNNLKHEISQLRDDYKALDKSHSAFVIFVMIFVLVIIYLICSYGISMYRTYSDFADFQRSVSDILRSFGY